MTHEAILIDFIMAECVSGASYATKWEQKFIASAAKQWAARQELGRLQRATLLRIHEDLIDKGAI